ncbi:MAG: RidA family protein [Chloroflexi bacterium]|nr:RidA family protein [Chloroflexota bacterium]
MSGERQAAYFGGEAERRYGYAQAVRAGDAVYVSGQIARDEGGELVGAGDMAAQMRAVYANIARALAPFGADLANVVEEVTYVTDVAAASEVAGEVRHEAYGVPAGEPIEVASTLVQVVALAHPDFMVEIRCTARL